MSAWARDDEGDGGTMMLCAAVVWLVVICAVCAGCATVDPIVRKDTVTVTNVVKVPTPVPCFDPADIPKLPPRTPVDVEHATTDQLAAAAAADAEAFETYARAVDKLWAQCLKMGTTK